MFYSKSNQYWEFSAMSPHPIIINGIRFETVEHYYHWSKFPGNHNAQMRILNARTAKLARDIGKNAKHARKDWEIVKLRIMTEGQVAKFQQHPELAKLLLSTKDHILSHYSPWDLYWGSDDEGLGANMLGNILMEIRYKSYKDDIERDSDIWIR